MVWALRGEGAGAEGAGGWAWRLEVWVWGLDGHVHLGTFQQPLFSLLWLLDYSRPTHVRGKGWGEGERGGGREEGRKERRDGGRKERNERREGGRKRKENEMKQKEEFTCIQEAAHLTSQVARGTWRGWRREVSSLSPTRPHDL